MPFPSVVSLLFLPLLGGALFCRTSHRYKFRFYRRSGYELFFTAATSGVCLLVLSLLLINLVPNIPCVDGYPCVRASSIESIWYEHVPDIPFLGTCFISFLAGIPAGVLLNFIDFRSERELKNREIRRYGTELEILAVNAVESLGSRERVEDAPMYMLTLKNGKVFVGFINEAPLWPGDTSYLRLVKLASGYRNSEKDVDIVSRYDIFIEKNLNIARKQISCNSEYSSPKVVSDTRNYSSEIDVPGSVSEVTSLPWDFFPSDFEIIVPLSEIMHVSPFEKEVRHPDPEKDLDWPDISTTSTPVVSDIYQQQTVGD